MANPRFLCKELWDPCCSKAKGTKPIDFSGVVPMLEGTQRVNTVTPMAPRNSVDSSMSDLDHYKLCFRHMHNSVSPASQPRVRPSWLPSSERSKYGRGRQEFKENHEKAKEK